jgi:hypothetical protein
MYNIVFHPIKRRSSPDSQGSRCRARVVRCSRVVKGRQFAAVMHLDVLWVSYVSTGRNCAARRKLVVKCSWQGESVLLAGWKLCAASSQNLPPQPPIVDGAGPLCLLQ